MLAVSSIQEFGYANRNADLAVGDLLVHVRTMANEFNLEEEDDIEKVMEYVATRRPVSFFQSEEEAKVCLTKAVTMMVSVKQVGPGSTSRAWIGHQALL